jgi:prevent-host-death family protein
MIHDMQDAANCETRTCSAVDLISGVAEHKFVKTVGIREAKSQFSRLLRRVATGEEIIITNRGVAVARLIPAGTPGPARKLGLYGSTFKVPDDFDAPLPDEILDLFEGRDPRKIKKS